MTVTQTETGPIRAFYRGLTVPSGLSIVIALAVTAATLTYCCLTIDERWVSQSSQLFGNSAEDDQDFVTRRALELRTGEPDSPIAILIGVEPVEDDWKGLDLVDSNGKNAGSTYDLRTASQSVWETLAICDQIPRDTVGSLFLFISPTSLEAGTEVAVELDRHPSFGFRSVSLALELHRQGESIVPFRDVYFLDNYWYLLSRIPTAFSRSIFLDHDLVNRKSLSEEGALPPKGVSPPECHSEENLALNLSVLENMLERLRASRLLEMSIILDDRSLNVDGDATEGTIDAQRLFDEVRAISERQQIELIDSRA